jgi:nucleotide-binding universal stress UspA family protein
MLLSNVFGGSGSGSRRRQARLYRHNGKLLTLPHSGAGSQPSGAVLVSNQEEGEAFEVISRAIKTMGHDLLILGTHGRTGSLILLGAVTEEALRRIGIDVLAVPPVRPL